MANILQIKSIRNVALQAGDGRNLRYVLQPIDLTENDPFIMLTKGLFEDLDTVVQYESSHRYQISTFTFKSHSLSL